MIDKGTEFLTKLLEKAKQMTDKEYNELVEKAKLNRDYGKYKIILESEDENNTK